MKIPTLKIGRRLLLAFGIQILFLAAIAGYALNRMQVLERHVTEIAAVNQREFASASEMRNEVSERFLLVEQMATQRLPLHEQDQPSALDVADQRYLNSEAALRDSFSQSGSTSPEELLALNQAAQLHDDVSRMTAVLLQQLRGGDVASARTLQQEQLFPLLRRWRDVLLRLERIQLDQNAEVVDHTSRLVAQAHWTMLVVAAFALLVSASLAWSITSSITRPLNHLLKSIAGQASEMPAAVQPQFD
ncbi:hypothetical protein SAMN05192549_108189 [Duganella sacchari]|uniref:Methyl-accepting chemotaxis protein n=1 Tax=Duganella sacchari TaxID=551987 RepID=A0A1M7QX72_9BURK|nr:hypothetical protein [Duganella sacchari]SHN36529.1 hypothetical protein SAMN05192549_108189 [Duganella sacchari]